MKDLFVVIVLFVILAVVLVADVRITQNKVDNDQSS